MVMLWDVANPRWSLEPWLYIPLYPLLQVLENKKAPGKLGLLPITDGNYHQVTWWEPCGPMECMGFGAGQMWFKFQLCSSHLWDPEQIFKL